MAVCGSSRPGNNDICVITGYLKRNPKAQVYQPLGWLEGAGNEDGVHRERVNRIVIQCQREIGYAVLNLATYFRHHNGALTLGVKQENAYIAWEVMAQAVQSDRHFAYSAGQTRNRNGGRVGKLPWSTDSRCLSITMKLVLV